MARKKKTNTGTTEEVNLTPMIDCTFQLIIFFIISAQMTSEAAKLLPPKPVSSMAMEAIKGTVSTKSGKGSVTSGGKVIKERITLNLYSNLKDSKKRKPNEFREAKGLKVAGCRLSYGSNKCKELKPSAGDIGWATTKTNPFNVALTKQLEKAIKFYATNNYRGSEKEAKKNVFIEIRADKDLKYEEIEPYLSFAANNGFEYMAISAVVNKSRKKKSSGEGE